MEIPVLQRIQKNLSEKRQNLTGWLSSTPASKKHILLGAVGEDYVQAHLHSLDTALEKAQDASLGVCDVCCDMVQPQLLEMDYTACVCLEHLSQQERRSLESELQFLQIVQKALLPQQVPSFTGLDVAAFSRPAQIVGGDYFDFFQYQDGAYGLAIADAMGHGVSASVIMSSLQAALRTLAPENTSPREMLQRINRVFLHNANFTTFVTVFLAHYNPTSRKLIYANAGHNPPLLYHSATQEITWLQPTGAAIGLVETHEYKAGQQQLAEGDILLLYTDGVTEAANALQEPFGSPRLAGLVQRNARLPVQELLRAVRQEWAEFMDGQAAEDDATLVMSKVGAL